MTTDYSALTDAELNQEAARLMGLKPYTNGFYWAKNGGLPFDFDPANDLNHAAELGAAFWRRLISLRWTLTYEYLCTTTAVFTARLTLIRRNKSATRRIAHSRPAPARRRLSRRGTR